jgi:hypothetical protein
MKKILGLFGIIGLLCMISQAQATSFAKTTLKKLVETSTLVVIAKVEKVESRWDDKHEKIFTYTTISILDHLKGNPGEKSLTIQELGGKVGSQALVVDGSAQFVEGEETLLFLIYHRDRYWVHSMAMGKFDIVGESGRKIALNINIAKDLIKLDTPEIVSLSDSYPKYDLNEFKTHIKEFVE